MTEYKRSIEEQIQNLPSIIDLKHQIRALKTIGTILRNKETKRRAEAMESELARITGIVELFYKTLGSRHWVFSDSLSLDRIAAILNNNGPEEAETALITYLKEPHVLDKQINRLNRFPDMRPRLDLLEKAQADYLHGRYYSSVLVVVSVMDGFVNDFNKAERKGLHARTPQEMETDNCVAAIFAGLPSVQSVFTKSVRKRIDEPLFEVERNALMHGMTTNFNNDIIASKAWCMLFAVADWAKSNEEKTNVAQDSFNFIGAIKQHRELAQKNRRTNELLDEWEQHEVDLDNPTEPDLEVFNSINGYCMAWKNKNYGQLADFLPNMTCKSRGAMAGEARGTYDMHPIAEFKVLSITRPAAAIAVVDIELKSSERDWVAEIRLARQNETNEPAAEWEHGNWKVMQYATSPFIDSGSWHTLRFKQTVEPNNSGQNPANAELEKERKSETAKEAKTT